MTFFLLAMVRNPDVFNKAREEMDRVVGKDKLPDFDNQDTLLYLECIFQEVLR